MSLRTQKQQELDELLQTFSTPGWAIFQRDNEELFKLLEKSAAKDCDTSAKWFERRGQLATLTHINEYEEAANNMVDTFDDLVFEDEDPEDEATNDLEE